MARPVSDRKLVSGLAAHEADGTAIEQLEAARLAYVELYEDAEAIAQSSISAAARGATDRSTAVRVLRRVPKRYRRKIPRSWRLTVSRALSRTGAKA